MITGFEIFWILESGSFKNQMTRNAVHNVSNKWLTIFRTIIWKMLTTSVRNLENIEKLILETGYDVRVFLANDLSEFLAALVKHINKVLLASLATDHHRS